MSCLTYKHPTFIELLTLPVQIFKSNLFANVFYAQKMQWIVGILWDVSQRVVGSQQWRKKVHWFELQNLSSCQRNFSLTFWASSLSLHVLSWDDIFTCCFVQSFFSNVSFPQCPFAQFLAGTSVATPKENFQCKIWLGEHWCLKKKSFLCRFAHSCFILFQLLRLFAFRVCLFVLCWGFLKFVFLSRARRQLGG